MELDVKLKEAIKNGDYRSESEDEYVKMLEADSKKNFAVKVGIGILYISLLITSLFIV